MGQVLVLNASYEPLNITTWRRAMVMMLKGKAESLEQDSTREIRRGTHLPTVIRLRQYVRVPFRQLPLTRRNLFHRDNHSCQYCGCHHCCCCSRCLTGLLLNHGLDLLDQQLLDDRPPH